MVKSVVTLLKLLRRNHVKFIMLYLNKKFVHILLKYLDHRNTICSGLAVRKLKPEGNITIKSRQEDRMADFQKIQSFDNKKYLQFT